MLRRYGGEHRVRRRLGAWLRADREGDGSQSTASRVVSRNAEFQRIPQAKLPRSGERSRQDQRTGPFLDAGPACGRTRATGRAGGGGGRFTRTRVAGAELQRECPLDSGSLAARGFRRARAAAV